MTGNLTKMVVLSLYKTHNNGMNRDPSKWRHEVPKLSRTSYAKRYAAKHHFIQIRVIDRLTRVNHSSNSVRTWNKSGINSVFAANSCRLIRRLYDVRAGIVSPGEAHPDLFAHHVTWLLAAVGRSDILARRIHISRTHTSCQTHSGNAVWINSAWFKDPESNIIALNSTQKTKYWTRVFPNLSVL